MANEPIVTLIPDGHSVAKIPVSRRKGLYPDGYEGSRQPRISWYEEIRVRQAKQNAEALAEAERIQKQVQADLDEAAKRRIELNRRNGSRRLRSATGFERRSGRPGCTSS